MQPDPIKPGIARYERRRPFDGVRQASSLSHRQAVHVIYSCFLCGPANLTATSDIVVFSEPGFLLGRSAAGFMSCATGTETEIAEAPAKVNPVVEMRSARRSLRQKAQEEMSEFEREYPW